MFEDKKECKGRNCCIDLIIFVLSIIFALVIGIIIGAETEIFTTLGIGAFVAFSVLVAILIIIRIITIICCKDKKDKCCCKD